MPDFTTAQSNIEIAARPERARGATLDSASSLVLIGVWFGIVTGFIEGTGLLFFQRLNWRRWGPMTHLSKEILWIAPIVDVLMFSAIGLLVALAARIVRRIPAMRVVTFLLVFLAIYDWLTLTERLYHRACLLLALGIAIAFTRWFQPRRESVFHFWRNNLVWLLGIWIFVFAGMQSAKWLRERHDLASLPPAETGVPNIILIVVDTLRADHLSAYGYARPTPNLDRIAREGVLFQNAISACSWTLPSHASLLTGRYPSDHGMENAQSMPWLGWGNTSFRGYRTLGEALEQKGYRTGAFSANQSYFTSNVGLGRGFIHFEDYFQSPKDMFLRTLYGREFARVYLNRTEKSKITRAIRFLGLDGLRDNRKRANEVNREALAWIDHGQQPFFAFLNYIDVHDAASLEWADSAPAWGLKSAVDKYDSAITYVDAEIGVLMQLLEQRGLGNNTVVIVTSDHGESLGQHDMQFHGIALYLEQIHVPLMLRYPGRIGPGLRVEPPVSNAALAATVMDLIGTGEQNFFPGRGLSGILTKGERITNSQNPISELAQNEIVIDPDRQARNVEPTAMDGDMKSVLTPQWHLIEHRTLGDQLYNWVADPAEVNNLIQTPQGKVATQTLKSEITQHSHP